MKVKIRVRSQEHPKTDEGTRAEIFIEAFPSSMAPQISYITVLQQKVKGSVTEMSPADSDTWRLTKQESAGRFLESIGIGEIFQLEVWNSNNFVFISLFTWKSVKEFHRSMLFRGTSETFRIFCLYPALGMRFEVGRT